MPPGRVTAKTKIFEIRIELRDVRPAVLRRIQVPGEMSLAGLHEVAQVAMAFVAAMADPAHPEHGHYHEWVGGSFDPAAFDLDAVNTALAALAWRPPAASARP